MSYFSACLQILMYNLWELCYRDRCHLRVFSICILLLRVLSSKWIEIQRLTNIEFRMLILCMEMRRVILNLLRFVSGHRKYFMSLILLSMNHLSLALRICYFCIIMRLSYLWKWHKGQKLTRKTRAKLPNSSKCRSRDT